MYMTFAKHRKICALALILLILAGACQANHVIVVPTVPEIGEQIPESVNPEEAATLRSLRQVDDYPLYTMAYEGDYSRGASLEGISEM